MATPQPFHMSDEPHMSLPLSSLKLVESYLKQSVKQNTQGDNSKKDKEKDADKGEDQEEVAVVPNSSIHFEEFQWDYFLKWLVTTILGLTLLNASVDFLRNYAVSCYIDTANRDEATYVNNYCFGSLPQTEYFTLYVIIHGALIYVPHVLWKTINSAYLKFFFNLVNSLDRLRDRSTGDYRPQNFDIILCIENEFTMRRLFLTYILKLVIQLVFSVGSILFSAIYFYNFKYVFQCPTDIEVSPVGWHLNSTVDCVYPSLRFLNLLQYADFLLLVLITFLLIYGFIWCIWRHPDELGYKTIAEMCSRSCLIATDYHYKRKKLSKRYDCIGTDVDFLLMVLFRASSGAGATMKDMLIENLMTKHYGKDRELLQLLLNQKDVAQDAAELFKQAKFRQIIKESGKSGSPRFVIETKYRPQLGLADDMEEPLSLKETKRLFNKLKSYPFGNLTELTETLIKKLYARIERKIRDHQRPFAINEDVWIKNIERWTVLGGRRKHLRDVLKEMRLESISESTVGEEVSTEESRSFQNQVYRFTQLVQCHRDDVQRLLALDVAFDGLGCTHILAWAIESVCSINFNSHYHNKSNLVDLTSLYNQISLVRISADLFSHPGSDQTQLTNSLNEVYFDCQTEPPRHVRRDGHNDKDDRYINFITVGPMKEDAKRVTVNLLLELLHNGRDIADNALMLTIRPLRISGINVSREYMKYIPSNNLFKEHFKYVPDDGLEPSSPQAAEGNDDNGQEERERADMPLINPQLFPAENEFPENARGAHIDELFDEDSFCTVGKERGIICFCGSIECVFEMKLYMYTHKQEERREDYNEISNNASSTITI